VDDDTAAARTAAALAPVTARLLRRAAGSSGHRPAVLPVCLEGACLRLAALCPQRVREQRVGLRLRAVVAGGERERLARIALRLLRLLLGGCALLAVAAVAPGIGRDYIGETAADLPAVLAVLSSLRNRPLAGQTVCFGELGLTGEIRPVPFGEERLREAAKQGFHRALVPASNVPRKPIEGLAVEGVGRLEQTLALAF
jgi:DNA repair protein RadA/Sms